MMTKKTKSRDLDHLIEQNDTELTFLSAYGGITNESEDPSSILSAVKRFLRAGGVKFQDKNQQIEFEFGYAKCVDNGCKIYKNRPYTCERFNCFETANLDEAYPENWKVIKELVD